MVGSEQVYPVASEVIWKEGAEEIRHEAPTNCFIAPLEMLWGADFRVDLV